MRVREATRNALEGERARQETAEALARTEARLAAIIESSDDAIVGKTLDGIVTNWNLGAERLFGYAALERIRQGKRVEHFETERIRKDGQRIHVSLTVSPIKDSNDRIIGASKIARDVSDRKRIEQERERLLENAERALAEGKRPAAPRTPSSLPFSHELRTPLSPILAWSIMLRQGTLDAQKTERALETIERCARIQAQLVEDETGGRRRAAGARGDPRRGPRD